jgi:hypothetical protein
MSWKDHKSIERIFNTFKRNNKVIYQQDVDALKHLKESIELSERQMAHDNKLFLKLMIVVLKVNLEYYGNIKTAIKETSVFLRLPVEHHIQVLQKSLNIHEDLEFFKSLGIETDNILKDEAEKLTENKSELLKKLMSSWTYETVEKSIYKSANDFLKDVDNYK